MADEGIAAKYWRLYYERKAANGGCPPDVMVIEPEDLHPLTDAMTVGTWADADVAAIVTGRRDPNRVAVVEAERVSRRERLKADVLAGDALLFGCRAKVRGAPPYYTIGDAGAHDSEQEGSGKK